MTLQNDRSANVTVSDLSVSDTSPGFAGRLEKVRQRDLPAILSLLENVLRDANQGASSLATMCRYHLETGGKRIRALLPSLVADYLDCDAAVVVPWGAACEMLHNATLVHDDVEDGDQVRRGRDTVWRRFGIPRAINLGDAMFYYAVLLVQQVAVPPEQRNDLVRMLLLETLRVIDGQEREFALRASDRPTLAEYFAMVEAKTSRLFALPMVGAAEMLGQESRVVKGLSEAARHVGVLFQVQDDVLDLYGDKGRDQIGSDIAEGKRSILAVHALECGHPEDGESLLRILNKDRAATTPDDIPAAMNVFDRTASLAFAIEEMHSRKQQALAIVRALDRPGLTAMIAGICEVVLDPIKELVDHTGVPTVPGTVDKTGFSSQSLDPQWYEDHAFCVALLPKVSRTFALSIGALPAALRDAVRVAYLLCRIVDSIEDEAKVVAEDREGLFDAFDQLTTDETADPRLFEALSQRADLGSDEAYRELCCGAGAVFRAFRALPEIQQDAIRPNVQEMSRGMREFARRADVKGQLRLADMKELERYCYFVAGTVGHLLTSLFEQAVPDLSDEAREAIRSRAVSFGLGLQMVNIVKDVQKDLERGDCYLPQDLAERNGVPLDSLLDPSHRPNALLVVRFVCAKAREHLQRAQEYTLSWPVPAGASVRLFCAVPLILALATLREVEDGADALRSGVTPKVNRELVSRVLREAREAVTDDEALVRMFHRYTGRADSVPDATPGVPKARPPVPSFEATAPAAGRGSDATKFERANARWQERSYEGLVLVTGSSGHLGANLVRRLLADGRRVRILLRPNSNNSGVADLNVERVFGDLRDKAHLMEAVRGCETIYHCAALVSTEQGDAAFQREIFGCNVLGTHHLLTAARESNVKRVVVTGSFSAVGRDMDSPMAPSSEEGLFYPFGGDLPYAHTKAQVEHECLKAFAEGLDVVVATSCAILGPADYKPSRMGQTLLDYAHGRLKAYIPGGFEFVAARDICEGHVLAMHRGRAGQKYVFSTEFLTIDEIMAIFEEVSGRPRPRLRLPPSVMAGLAELSSRLPKSLMPSLGRRFTPGAVRLLRMNRRADISKARNDLGYEPTSARKAIHDAYADFARRGLVPAAATARMRSADAPWQAPEERPTVPRSQPPLS